MDTLYNEYNLRFNDSIIEKNGAMSIKDAKNLLNRYEVDQTYFGLIEARSTHKDSRLMIEAIDILRDQMDRRINRNK